MRRVGVLVLTVAAALLVASCTVEGGADDGRVAAALVGTWEPVTVNGEKVVPEVDNLGTWTFDKATFTADNGESSCAQPYELSDVSEPTTAQWTRSGPATWTGPLAENPEPPDCPFGFNMPAELTVDGDSLIVTEGVYDPPESGGLDTVQKVIEFDRKS